MLWLVRLLNFQLGPKKFETFLHKNQHHQWKCDTLQIIKMVSSYKFVTILQKQDFSKTNEIKNVTNKDYSHKIQYLYHEPIELIFDDQNRP